MNVTIVTRSSDATCFADQDQALAAWHEACAAYVEWAFRIRSGSNMQERRIEAFKIGTIVPLRTGWLRLEAA